MFLKIKQMKEITMFGNFLKNLTDRKPLIHSITNYVTANDCANILLACGASPIMADDVNEAAEITGICDGLNISLGTLSSRVIPSMLAAGARANSLGHPVVLDAVGIGASHFRLDTASQLISKIKFSIIKGNISEIKSLAIGLGLSEEIDSDASNAIQSAKHQKTSLLSINKDDVNSNSDSSGKDNTIQSGKHNEIPLPSSGVDAAADDAVTREQLDDTVRFIKHCAKKAQTIIAATGAIDIISDGNSAFCIYNGNSMMSRVTGTGCQLSAMTAAYAAANPDNMLIAAAAAATAMGVCGETAFERLSAQDGSATYRNYIIDAVYRLTPAELERRAKYEIR